MLRRVCAPFVLASLLATASPALAYPMYLESLPMDRQGLGCQTCHVTSGGGGTCALGGRCLNPFGHDFRAAGYSYTAAVQSGDSDGDGVHNDPEIAGSTFPGFPNPPDMAGCDMATCADSSFDDCGSSPLRCTRSVDAEQQYSWIFSCDAGYTFSPPWTCNDIDECAPHPCNTLGGGTGGEDGQGCTQTTPGNYTCSCSPGYGFSSGTCELSNECNLLPSVCVGLAGCVYSTSAAGDYVCTCPSGYEGDGRASGTGCSDVDECARGLDDCSMYADCANTPGSFTCACRSGFTDDSGGAGRVCTDIDECMDPAFFSLCSSVATCVNSIGSWACVCNPGFEGDGRTCADIDECARGLDECDAQATCTNTVGAYTCACTPGYEGSGVTCRDVDECAEGTGGCRDNELCVNQIGAPNLCVCAAGYTRSSADAPCAITCGDATRGPGEQCDDGNAADGDGCSASCAIEPGWACREPTAHGRSTCMETCGDGLIDALEECDDGDANSDTAPDACRTSCVRAHCGDDVMDSGEACDEGDANSDTAPNGCRTSCDPAYCGDGVVDTGEVCDPGGGVPGASVVGTCTTLCAPDAGVDPNDPPALTGGAGGCRAAGPAQGGAPFFFGALVALALALRRRR